MPTDRRTVVKRSGSVSGSTTRRKIWRGDAPNVCATRMRARASRSTAAWAPTTTLRKVAIKIRKNLEASPMPSHTTASGIRAIFGSGRRNCTKGLSAAASGSDIPISSPSGTPIIIAQANAPSERARLTAMFCHSGT